MKDTTTNDEIIIDGIYYVIVYKFNEGQMILKSNDDKIYAYDNGQIFVIK